MNTAAKVATFDAWCAWNKTLPTKFCAAVSKTHILLSFDTSTFLRSYFGRVIGQQMVLGMCVAGQHALSNQSGLSSVQSNGYIYVYSPPTMWWVAREMQRLYMTEAASALPTEILNTLHSGPMRLPCPLPWHFVRVSNEPGNVDFFFTMEDGERDKLTTMAFGRYIKRFAPYMTDAAIRHVEARFRTLISDEFDVFMGGENIIKYYNNGPHSCMVFSTSAFPPGGHPLLAYDAPGWGIAILAANEEKTRASARSLVWIDPADEKRKHFIRVYGDPVLEARLKKAGFQNTIPDGAPLKYVPSATPGNILLPYFDSTSNNTAGNGGYIFMDNDRPVMLTYSNWTEQRSTKPYLTPFLIRHAHASLSVPDRRWHGGTCTWCGKTGITEGLFSTIRAACKACADTYGLILAQTYNSAHKFHNNIVAKDKCIKVTDVYYENTPDILSAYKIGPLDPLFYPANEHIYTPHEYCNGATYWKARETIVVVDYVDGKITLTHRNVLDNGVDFEVLHALMSIPGANSVHKCYATEAALPLAAKTSAGRLIIPYLLHRNYVRRTGTNTYSVPNGYHATNILFGVKRFGTYASLYEDELLDIEIDEAARRLNRGPASVTFERWVAGHHPPTFCVPCPDGTHSYTAAYLEEFLDAPFDELFVKKYKKYMPAITTTDHDVALSNLHRTWRRIRARWNELYAVTETARPVAQPELSTAD